MENDETSKPETPQKPKDRLPPLIGSSSWSRLAKSSSALGVLAALATMLGTVAVTFTTFRDRDAAEQRAMEAARQRDVAIRSAAELENTRNELSKLRASNEMLQKALEHGAKNGSTQHYTELNPLDRQTLNQIKADQDQLRSRFSALETTLVTTPEKAIAVPMLKQQLDTLQDRSHADLDSVRGEIGRLFTLTQWFIGLMFTIALGVFGLALSNLRKATEKPSEKERGASI